MLRGELTPHGTLRGELASRGTLYGTLSMTSHSYPGYSGAYEADALFSEQVFATSHRVMMDDFTVHAINYTEAPNQYGTTVTIGG